MELRELRYFLAVAREESITKAAESLYIAQPSLTKQMQNLEKEIGRPLFLRGSRRITLTDTGILLKKRAEELLALYEKTEAEILAPEDTVCGDVFIGGGESYAVQTVAKAAKSVQDDYPLVRFSFLSSDAGDVMERLDKGLIDFGILVDLTDHPGLSKYHSIRLPQSDTWGVLMRKDSPLAAKERITADELRQQPLICSLQSLRKGSRIYEWFGGRMEELRLMGRYNLLYNATLLVREGIGYAISLERLINTTGESELCFRPLWPAVETHLDIVWKRYAVFSRPAQVFLDRLRMLIGAAADAPDAPEKEG